MSHDASALVKPEITDPKAKVNTVITHEAVVKTPVLYGFKKYNTKTTKTD